MEEFPNQNPNPEYINNEGEESQEPRSFTEHMAEMAAREKSFDELRRDGEVPEGVRDERDYQEFLTEQNARRAESTERDRALASEIENIQNPYDKDFIISLLPSVYDENGEKRQNLGSDRFDMINLGLEFIGDGNRDIKKFSERKMEELNLRLRDGIIGSEKEIGLNNKLGGTLNILETCWHCSRIQKETDNNEATLAEIGDLIKNDRLLYHTFSRGHILRELKDFKPIAYDSFFLTESEPHESRTKRPEYDKGIVTLILKDAVQNYQHQSDLMARRDLRALCDALCSYCEGNGFGEQMETALTMFSQEYEACIMDANRYDFNEESTDSSVYNEEKGRIRTKSLCGIMAIREAAYKVNEDRDIYQTLYLGNIEKGEKILSKLA